MNRNIIIGCLGGLLLASGVWFIHTHRRDKERINELESQVVVLQRQGQNSELDRSVSEQMEQIAHGQQALSEERSQEAIRQSAIAQAATLRSEAERRKALKAQAAAEISAAEALESYKMAEHQRQNAEYARMVADTLNYISLGRTLGSQSYSIYQTGNTVLFSYETDLSSKSLGSVSIKQKQASLESILTRAFSGKGIAWKVVNNTVILTAEQPQDKGSSVVSGRVVDSNGDPLPGAGVMIKGTTKGTTTDADGRYSLPVASNASLEFSFIGYATQVVPVGGRSTVNVTLSDDQNILEDVVVVGYGTQNRKTLTSAIAKVDGDKLMDAPVTTVGDALKGKVTGLRVTSNNNMAGEAPRFLIRGGSSINRSNDALCLVDGVQRDISDINPNDIESIEVLKDAASSAIYGARASNGVILVTTRKGDAFKEPQIVFDTQVGIIGPSRMWDLADATEFLRIVRPAAAQGPNASLVLDGLNGAGVGNTTSTAVYSTRYLNDGEAVPEGYLSMADPVDPTKTIIYTDHDWQKEWYHPSLLPETLCRCERWQQEMKYAASVGYVGDDGMVAMSSFRNFTMHGNTAFDITKWLTASTTFDFTNGIKHPMTNDYFTVLGRGIMMSPTHIGKYPDGTFATGGTNKNQQTAEFYETFYDRETQRQNFMGSINLKWNITDWLTATGQYSFYDNNYRGSYYTKGEVNGSVNFVGPRTAAPPRPVPRPRGRTSRPT